MTQARAIDNLDAGEPGCLIRLNLVTLGGTFVTDLRLRYDLNLIVAKRIPR